MASDRVCEYCGGLFWYDSTVPSCDIARYEGCCDWHLHNGWTARADNQERDA